MTKTDVAVIVIDAVNDVSDFERSLVSEFKKLGTAYILAANKIETVADPAERIAALEKVFGEKVVPISALEKKGIDDLRSLIVKTAPEAFEDGPMLRDLVKEGDTVVLCVPIDKAAPQVESFFPRCTLYGIFWTPMPRQLLSRKISSPSSLQTLKNRLHWWLRTARSLQRLIALYPKKFRSHLFLFSWRVKRAI